MTPGGGTARSAELVTVAIPARNESATIAGVLDSVLAQTYEHLQIIVVDGDSDDDTRRIVQDYADRDPRVELLDNPDRVIPVAMNLALSIARQKDFRVMLFDFDFRRPNLHKIIGHTPDHSMHEVLSGDVPFFDVAKRISDNLIVGLNAGPGKNPAELFQSERAKDILDAIQADWQPDVIIIDTPPMLGSDDHVNLMNKTDCALLVIAAEMSKLPNVDFCEKELGQLTNVLGIVLNKCRYPDDTTGYSYYG